MDRSSTLQIGALLVAVLLAACRSPAGAPSVTHQAPTVGQKTRSTQEVALALKVDLSAVHGQRAETRMKRAELTTRVTEVLAVNDHAATKVKVTYAEKVDIANKGGQEQKDRSPIEGKTYVVAVAGGVLTVTDASGAAVPPAEAEWVKKDHAELGKPDPLAASLGQRPLRPGVELPELARALHEELVRGADARVKPEVTNIQVRFREARGGLALFDVSVTLTQDEGSMTLEMALQGTLGLRQADAQRAQLTLEGPVSLRLAKGAELPPDATFDAEGDMSLTQTQTWL